MRGTRSQGSPSRCAGCSRGPLRVRGVSVCCSCMDCRGKEMLTVTVAPVRPALEPVRTARQRAGCGGEGGKGASTYSSNVHARTSAGGCSAADTSFLKSATVICAVRSVRGGGEQWRERGRDVPGRGPSRQRPCGRAPRSRRCPPATRSRASGT